MTGTSRDERHERRPGGGTTELVERNRAAYERARARVDGPG
ncbi:hypothetical protein [Micromonospora echinaurantiaca]|nr:hypothetical protein [Micromonospora echinaurantiaca]